MLKIFSSPFTWPSTLLKSRAGSAFAMVLSAVFLFCSVSVAEDRHEDHEALRALLKQSITALNGGKIEALKPLMQTDVLITTAEQHVSHNFDEFKKYYEGLFTGPNAKLTSISFQPTADDLTKFISTNVGVVTGSSTDTYTFKDGESRTMTSRWTATLLNDAGQWKVASFHFGVDFMDNPVLDAVRGIMLKLGIGCALGGLLIGVLALKACSGKCAKT